MLYSRFSLVIYFMHSIYTVNTSAPVSQFLPHPPSTLGDNMFVLCVYISALHMGSSVPFFEILYLCVNVCLSFSDLPQSILTVLGSIHILCKWHNSVPFYDRVIFHLVPQELSHYPLHLLTFNTPSRISGMRYSVLWKNWQNIL